MKLLFFLFLLAAAACMPLPRNPVSLPTKNLLLLEPASETANRQIPSSRHPTPWPLEKRCTPRTTRNVPREEGAGDGDLAVDMHLKLRDDRDPASLKDITDASIHPSSQMAGARRPARGSHETCEIWDVVNYISFPRKNSSPENTPTPQPE